MTENSDSSDEVPPGVVRDAVVGSLVAEFTTVRDRRPSTVPLTPFYDEGRDLVVATAPPAFAAKAERAAANPKVGMLLRGPSGPLHLTGTATVRDDDLEANAVRVQALIEDEPPSDKRAALRETTAFLDSRLGRVLFDWYAMRVLIEVEPVSVTSVSPSKAGDFDTYPAETFDDDAANDDRTVATVVTADGWPRTWPLTGSTFDDGSLRLSPPDDVAVGDGQPACVLRHRFSPDAQDISQRLVRGRITDEADGVGFRPASSFALRNETALDTVRFVVAGKRRTKRYFEDRDETYRRLPRPGALLGNRSDADAN